MATVGEVWALISGFLEFSELNLAGGGLGALKCLIHGHSERGEVAHFAQSAAGGLAVNVNMRARGLKGVLEPERRAGTFAVAEQVDHDGARLAHRRASKGPAKDGAQVVLELGACAGFDGVVA